MYMADHRLHASSFHAYNMYVERGGSIVFVAKQPYVTKRKRGRHDIDREGHSYTTTTTTGVYPYIYIYRDNMQGRRSGHQSLIQNSLLNSQTQLMSIHSYMQPSYIGHLCKHIVSLFMYASD